MTHEQNSYDPNGLTAGASLLAVEVHPGHIAASGAVPGGNLSVGVRSAGDITRTVSNTDSTERTQAGLVSPDSTCTY